MEQYTIWELCVLRVGLYNFQSWARMFQSNPIVSSGHTAVKAQTCRAQHSSDADGSSSINCFQHHLSTVRILVTSSRLGWPILETSTAFPPCMWGLSHKCLVIVSHSGFLIIGNSLKNAHIRALIMKADTDTYLTVGRLYVATTLWTRSWIFSCWTPLKRSRVRFQAISGKKFAFWHCQKDREQTRTYQTYSELTDGKQC